MRESMVEKKLVQMVRLAGGTALKLNGPGDRGKPDRLVLLPGGRAVFVEVKAPRKSLRKLQRHWFELLGNLGFDCEMVDGVGAVERLMEELDG